MATPFNLTARLNVTGPVGVKPVVDNLRRQLRGIKTQVAIEIPTQTNNRLVALNKNLVETDRLLKSIATSSTTAAANIDKIAPAFNKANQSVNRTNRSVKTTTQTINQTAKAVRSAADEIQEFGRVSGLAVRRFAGFTVGTTIIFGLISALSRATGEAISFERELTKIAQVTGNTVRGISNLGDAVTRLSTELGVSSSELLLAARTLSQAGFAAKDTEIALRALARASLAPTFRDIQSTTEGAIAAVRQFNLDIKNLDSTLGSINAVAGQFAVESEDIINAIRRTGGVFAAAANPRNARESQRALNEFIALFTSVRATTRESAESIATGLRTIFTRVQRRGTIEALRDLNVILEEGGRFVGPFEAVERLNEALTRLPRNAIELNAILEALGGFRQIGKTIPLIFQFATAQEALQVAQEGSNSLTRDQTLAQQTLEVQLTKVRERFLALVREITGGTAFRGLTSTILTLTDSLINLVEAFEPVLPFLAGLTAIRGISAVGNFTRGFTRGVRGAGGPEGLGERVAGGRAESNLRSQNTIALQNNTQSVDQSTKSSTDARSANTKLQSSLKLNTDATTLNTQAIRDLTNRIANVGTGILSGGRTVRRATGGLVPGRSDRDDVKLMAKGGEFVLNRRGVKRAGLGNLQRFNSGGPIRLQDGGGEELRPVTAKDLQKFVKSVKLFPSDAKKIVRADFADQALRTRLFAEARANRGDSAIRAQQAQVPNIAGEGNGPLVTGFFLKGTLNEEKLGRKLIQSQDVLGPLRAAKIIPPGTKGIRLPVDSLFPNAKKAEGTIQAIQSGIERSTFNVSKSLGASDVDEALIKRAISSEGVDLADSAGKLFEAGLSVGAGFVEGGGKQKSLDFVNPDNFQKLLTFFGGNTSARFGDAKLTSNSDAFRSIRRQFADFLARDSIAAPLRQAFQKRFNPDRMQSGGRPQKLDVALTPGELVFGPQAAKQAGKAGLNKFNKTGDPSGLGSISKGIFQVPGTGNSDSFRTQLPEGSFVIRKRSAEGFASGGAVGRMQEGGPVDDIARQINSRLNLAFSNIEKSARAAGESATGMTEGLQRLARQFGVSTTNLRKFAEQRERGEEGKGSVRRAVEAGVAGQVIGRSEREQSIVRETFRAGGAQGTREINIRRAIQAIGAETAANLRGGIGEQTGRPRGIGEEAQRQRNISRQRQQQAEEDERRERNARRRRTVDPLAISARRAQNVSNTDLPRLSATIENTLQRSLRPVNRDPNTIRLDAGFSDTVGNAVVGRVAQDIVQDLDNIVRSVDDSIEGRPIGPITRQEAARQDFERIRQGERGFASGAQRRIPRQQLEERNRLAGLDTRATQASLKAFDIAITRGKSEADALALANKASSTVLRRQENTTKQLENAQKQLSATVNRYGRSSTQAIAAQNELARAQSARAKAFGGAAPPITGGGILGRVGGGFRGLGGRVSGALNSPIALGAAFAAPQLLGALGNVNTDPNLSAASGAISGALGGAFTGAAVGPGGAIVGALAGGASAAINQRSNTILNNAQNELRESVSKVDEAFQALEENINDAKAIKDFNIAVSEAIGSVNGLRRANDQQASFGGTVGGTVSGIFAGIGSLITGRDRQEAQRVGSIVGPIEGLAIETRRFSEDIERLTGGIINRNVTAIAANPLQGTADLLSRTFGGTVQDPNERIREVLEQQRDASRREEFGALNPIARQTRDLLEQTIVNAVPSGGQIRSRDQELIIDNFIRQSGEAAQSLTALNFGQFEKFQDALEEVGNDSDIAAGQIRKVISEITAQVAAQENVRRTIASNRREIEQTADAIQTLGNRASRASEDFSRSLNVIGNIGSVVSGGTVSAGRIRNPFENVGVSTADEIAQGVQTIIRRGGGGVSGPLQTAVNDVGQSRIIRNNLTSVLQNAIERADSTLDGDREQEILNAISSDTRLSGLNAATREQLAAQFRGIIGNREGEGVGGFDIILKEAANIVEQFVGRFQVSEETLAKSFQAIVEGNLRVAEVVNQIASSRIAGNRALDRGFGLRQQRARQIAGFRGRDVGPNRVIRDRDNFIRRLTRRAGVGEIGVGTTDVGTISTAIINLQNQLVADSKARADAANQSRETQNELNRRIEENTVRLADAKAALEKVADASEALGAIQSRLADFQRRREAGGSLVERLANARQDPAAARELAIARQDALAVLSGQSAGTRGGADLLRQIAGTRGQEALDEINARIRRGQARFAGIDPRSRTGRGLAAAGTFTARGESSTERRLIEQFQTISDAQIEAIQAAAKETQNQAKEFLRNIRTITNEFNTSIKAIVDPAGRGASGGTGGTSLADTTRSFSEFSTRLAEASENLRNVNIPETVEVAVAPITTNVNLNGAEVLSGLEPFINQVVTERINESLRRQINPITGETAEVFS